MAIVGYLHLAPNVTGEKLWLDQDINPGFLHTV